MGLCSIGERSGEFESCEGAIGKGSKDLPSWLSHHSSVVICGQMLLGLNISEV